MKCKHLELRERRCKRSGKMKDVKYCKFHGMIVSAECRLCKNKENEDGDN